MPHLSRLHIFVLVDKTKICIFRIRKRVTCHKYFGPKTRFFSFLKTCDHYALVFTRLLHKLILLFFDSNLHKSRKNSGKWTSMMSKIDIDERLLGKFDAALGVLRNFLGSMSETPYMLWCFLHLVKIQIPLAGYDNSLHAFGLSISFFFYKCTI